MSSHPFTPTRLSSPRASFASRIAFILLSLLASSQLAAAAPRFRPSTLTNPHPHGPTPQVAIPARPKITAYADFDHHLRRRTPNWRENHGVGHAWKRSEVEDLPDDLFTDKVEFARRGLVKAVVKEIRAAAPKPTTSTRKATTTTTRPRSSTTTSSKTTTSSSKAPVTTTSSPSSSPTTSSPASTSSSSSSSTTSSSTTSASSTSSSSATTTSSSLVPTSTLAPCVGSEANASYISSLFAYGGIGYTVELCPGANIALEQAVFIWWANQTLTTQGNPTGDTRATLTIANANISCAIFSALNYVDYVSIQNIQVDGARPALGIQYGGLALIEIGGYTTGQAVKNVHAYEPRGWSALHIAEGYANFCNGAQILNNQIGPAGHAPSGAQQFKRDSTGTYTPGQWADGISIACRNSLVQGNTVTDTTDGGIVIFGALGSQITGNTIIANDRQALGGINLVDWTPFSGAYTGTVVSNNQIISQASLIKLGIAVGTMSWGTDNRTIARTFDGEIKNNVFSSGPTGYFGYSISVAGHENITISGNTAANANFGGVESSSCFTYWLPLPTPQPFIADPWTTPGCQFQSDFLVNTTLVLPVCRGPKP